LTSKSTKKPIKVLSKANPEFKSVKVTLAAMLRTAKFKEAALLIK